MKALTLEEIAKFSREQLQLVGTPRVVGFWVITGAHDLTKYEQRMIGQRDAAIRRSAPKGTNAFLCGSWQTRNEEYAEIAVQYYSFKE